MAQWAHYARLKVPFHLYVPMGSVDVARRLAADNKIARHRNLLVSIRSAIIVRFASVYRTGPAFQAAGRSAGAAGAGQDGAQERPARAANGRQRPRRSARSRSRQSPRSRQGREAGSGSRSRVEAGTREAGRGREACVAVKPPQSSPRSRPAPGSRKPVPAGCQEGGARPPPRRRSCKAARSRPPAKPVKAAAKPVAKKAAPKKARQAQVTRAVSALLQRPTRLREHVSASLQPAPQRRGSAGLLYWFRTPPHVKMGRAAFDETRSGCSRTSIPASSSTGPGFLRRVRRRSAPEPERPRRPRRARRGAPSVTPTPAPPPVRRGAACRGRAGRSRWKSRAGPEVQAPRSIAPPAAAEPSRGHRRIAARRRHASSSGCSTAWRPAVREPEQAAPPLGPFRRRTHARQRTTERLRGAICRGAGAHRRGESRIPRLPSRSARSPSASIPTGG